MKVLVIGSGGREHVLVWKLKQSRKVDKLFCVPGNAGIAQIAKCASIKPDDFKAIGDFAHRNKIGLVVVGPEDPLAGGIVDDLRRRRLKVFGPSRKAARLEGCKMKYGTEVARTARAAQPRDRQRPRRRSRGANRPVLCCRADLLRPIS